jgi:uncharacterized protein (TIGR00369 family)
MPVFEVQDSTFEARVRGSFARQRVMQAIGASLTRVTPGEVEIVLPFRQDLTQQHGFLHAGIVSTIADSACGYAAYSLMPADAAVLTVEYKVNFLSPAQGDRMIARARVTKPGRTVTVCTCDVFAMKNGQERIVATMLGTIMTVREREGLVG